MTSTERAQSFGAVADAYDRTRPAAPDEALNWLVPPDCSVAVDLGAGTGLFTRRLHERVPHVVAVEPDDRMRHVLQERSPGVEALSGTAESIPLPDAAADGVYVSSAWHWMDPDVALPEIARVLRPGGRLGVLWTGRDRNVPWVAELDGVMDLPARLPNRLPHQLLIPPAGAFEQPERALFSSQMEMTAADLVVQLSTYSGSLIAEEGDRTAALNRAEGYLSQVFPDGRVVLPIRSVCWRARRP